MLWVARPLAAIRPPRLLGGLARRAGLSTDAPSPEDEGPLKAYNRLVATGVLREDAHQRAAAAVLQGFHESMHTSLASSSSSSSASFFSRWFGGSSGTQASSPDRSGVYMYGGVGAGKTRLMDILYDTQPASLSRLRVHFHAFMLDVHERLHTIRRARPDAPDALAQVARQYAEIARLLCFDEFQVTDVADAMILKTLFSNLFDNGVYVVFTSNRPPADLYKNGLNRPLFLPFIALLKERCIVYNLDSGTDYRLQGQHDHLQPVFFSGETASALLAREFKAATDSVKVETNVRRELVEGRSITVPMATENIAWFTFSDLCRHALGASDYLAIAREFHTIFVDGVPHLSIDRRDEMRRFITLVDVFYENHTKLLISAVAPLRLLYVPQAVTTTGTFAGEEEHFALDRTVSRLSEMQSANYLRDHYIRVNHPERFESLRSHAGK